MARTDNLTNFLTDVATAIKTKTGDSTAIPASQFDTKIANITTGHLDNTEYTEANDDLDDILENTQIPSGTINIIENGQYDVTEYINANVNIEDEFNANKVWQDLGYSIAPDNSLDTYSHSFNILDNWDSSITSLQNYFKDDTNLKYLPLIDIHNVTNMYSTFWNCINLISIPLLDTSNVTTMRGLFFICNALKVVPLLDTRKVTSMRNMFYECNVLQEVPLFITSNVEDMASMFYNCKNIRNIPQFDTSKVTDMSNMFYNCFLLTNDSLNNIMKMCINATTYTGTKTLAFIGLTSTQATTCQSLSNYQDFLNAGWTTGF